MNGTIKWVDNVMFVAKSGTGHSIVLDGAQEGGGQNAGMRPMELMVEASPRRIFANAHTYHINSISVNSDGETYLSADDLRYKTSYLS